MRKDVFISAVAAVIATGLVAGCSGRSPVVVVTNASEDTITVRLETDVGESYSVGAVAPGNEAKVKVTGRDKALWVVAEFPSGRVLQSQHLYTTAYIRLTANITDGAVELAYEK